MMKKIVTILAAAMLTLGAAANAMAYFSNGDLIQVAYVMGGTNEVATDLGSASSLVSGGTVTLTGSNALSLSALGASSWDQVNVVYFALDTATKRVWESASDSVTTNKNAYTAFASAMSNLYLGYQGAGSTQTVSLAQSDVHSYNTLFNNNDTSGVSNGVMANLNTNWTGVEMNLAALATGGTATATIYSKIANTTSALAATPLTIVASSDGTVTASSGTPTPIPPRFLLMGSGLLGMVGIRRKVPA